MSLGGNYASHQTEYNSNDYVTILNGHCFSWASITPALGLNPN